ncbi:Plasmodium exported protein (hyp10), unknown function [Plasmodium sp. gorilla clade G2]|uniref:Plasmodium exported protein (hyp10), unknown function n=1 Tax=Plasmodium sp. gorilla clade G2 TaxID=880535 RepID=UPI000D228C55|nr:Plasmodium exported protein (hyp10), unknown function [Plasmodium sp. gorilla clade G2]SOV12745.1 Plasmodium exported protein (hyp10), unknown function [Plasmodium sp. gorilla clade G2]
MTCNYFKLSLFSILVCILIITHKFSGENICYNKTNTVDIINTGYKRLLSESQETDLFKTNSRENSLTYPIDNKLDENVTEYHKTSSVSTLNEEIQQEQDTQTEQVELENENNNESNLQRSHKKIHYKKIYTRILLLLPFPVSILFYMAHSINKKNKKKKNNKQNEKNIHEDQPFASEKNIDAISVY